MCQVRLIIVPDHIYQFQPVCRLEIRKMCQVRLIIVFENLYQVLLACRLREESIDMWQVRLISVPDHTYQFKHVHRPGIRKY